MHCLQKFQPVSKVCHFSFFTGQMKLHGHEYFKQEIELKFYHVSEKRTEIFVIGPSDYHSILTISAHYLEITYFRYTYFPCPQF